MLSQRIPAAACYLHAGVAPEESKTALKEATAEFDKILKALEFGDESLGIIGAETRPKTLRDIQKTTEMWTPLHKVVDEIMATGTTDELVAQLIDHNMEILEQTEHLVAEIASEYANPVELLEADVIVIEIASRQRMLTQEIAKDACLVETGYHVEEEKELLQKMIHLFNVSLEAMRHGMPAAGVAPAPTQEIADGLDHVLADWGEIKSSLDKVAAGEEIEHHERELLFQGLTKAMHDMSETVHLYSKHSKLNL